MSIFRRGVVVSMDPLESEVKVAICGRPNVGKSTLFNRLTSKRERAVVDERPGITRDRKYGHVEWSGRRFILIDSGGFEPDVDGIASKVTHQTQIAIEEGRIILLMVDFKDGVVKGDLELAAHLRRSKRRVILVVNKVDHHDLGGLDLGEYYRLGFGDPIPISALHGINLDRVLDMIIEGLAPSPPSEKMDEIRVAICGRPNVGKSSLLNRIVGEERVVVDETPGTTRDSIDTLLEYDGTRFLLIDTAGIRKRMKIRERVERAFVGQAIESIRKADVAMLLLEAPVGIVNMDKRILKIMEELGCGGILVVNKWDLTKGTSKEDYKRWVLSKIPFRVYLPVSFISAITGEGIPQLMNLAKEVAGRHRSKVSTSLLNHTIQKALKDYTPPLYRGREVKIYYATQRATSPPTFLLFANYPGGITTSYIRYLEGRVREEFALFGTPLKFEVRRRRG